MLPTSDDSDVIHQLAMTDAASTPADRDAATTTSPVSTAELRLPNFWQKNPRDGFVHAQARFQLRHITSQQTTYLHVVAALPSDIAHAVDDLLPDTPSDAAGPPVAPLQRTWRPSQLLYRMRQLIDEPTSAENQLPILRELFLQRLPQSARMVPAGSEEVNFDRVAALADRIYDCPSPVQIPIAAARVSPEERLSRLEETIDRLAISPGEADDSRQRGQPTSVQPVNFTGPQCT